MNRQLARRYATAALIVVALAGLLLKEYRGPAQNWVNHWGPASVAYELFFILLAFLFFPRGEAVTTIAVSVCLGTCIIEFLQLWHPTWLDAIRSTFLGASVLGTTFSWWDLPAYWVGSFLGWLLLRRIVKHCSD